MKPKKKSSGVNPDIRSFFSLSPAGPATAKSKPRTSGSSPFSASSRRASGIGTPSTAAGTPPSPARSLANSSTATATGTATVPTSTKRAAATSLTPGRPRKTPPPRPRPSPASSQAEEVVCLSGSPVPLRSQLGSCSPGTAAASLLGLVNKENGSGQPAAVSAAEAVAAATAPAQMSGYFLEGPAVPARSGGDAEGVGNLAPARYALPLGEFVVGRDSVRDNSPANRNKLRIGIDKREEGVSRSQATLKAYVPAGRVLVVHKQGAINGIRIVRWAGSPGITTAEKVERRANPAAAAKALRAGQLLQTGQQSYLYPGDTLQLDGFRAPASSTCSFVLHPLPRGWTAPPLRSGSIGGGGGSSSGSRPCTPAASPRTTPTLAARKASPGPAAAAAGGIVTRRAATPKSNHGAAGSRGGAATTPAPSSLPPRASSTGKARAAAGTKSPATARAATSAAAAAAASSAAEGVPASPAVDGDTVKKKLRMSLGVAGRSSSGGGGGSIATPPSTAGRLDCPSPAAAEAGAEAPSSGAAKRPRPEVEEGDVGSAASASRSSAAAAVVAAPTWRKPSAPRTPTRAARSAAAPGGASSGPTKRLKGASASAKAASGSAALPPAAGAGSSSGSGVVPATATAAAAAAATADASQVPTTPRERAARLASSGGEGAQEGGSEAGGSKWKKGDVVVLRAQVSKGVNKLGGVAHVLSVFEDGTYLVKLSLGGAGPTRVSSDLLFSYTPSPEKGIRGRRTTSRRRDGGESREVDPSNGWISSSSSSSSSSPGLSTAPSRPQRAKRERRSGVAGSKAEDKATPTSGRKAGVKAAAAAAASTRGGNRGDRSTRSSKTGAGSGAAAAAASGADADAAVAAARPGDRARVLYDETDWYMATIIAVHRSASVTVRFDDGSEARVTLAPGDAEVCADDALAPTRAENGGPPTPTSSRSRGGGSSNRPSRGRTAAAKKGVRALGPGGRVLREGEGLALTEGRARALLDTAPERLVGLVYQEKHPGYGGWWETRVTEVSSERVGDDGAGKGKDGGVNKLWPESVVVGQMEQAAAPGGEGGPAWKGEQPDFVYTRKTSSLLSRLRTWDKQREAEWEATLEKEEKEEEEEAADTAAEAKPSSSSVKRAAKKELPPASASRSASRDVKKKPVAPVAAPKRKTPTPKRAGAGAAGSSASGPAAAAAAVCPVPTTAEGGDGGQSKVSQGDEDTEEGEKTTGVKQTKASIKKQQAAEKEAADQRALPTCPFCRCEFYVTETQDEVDRHLSSCSSRPKPTTAVVATSTPMPPSLSSSLMIGLKGEDLESLVAAVAEFAARGVRPTVVFCDRVMQAISKSRCHFQTEYLRRLMTNSLEAFPECWEPLNWSRFEETLQELVLGQENLALNARVTYLNIALDCLEASRRRRQQQQQQHHLNFDSNSCGGGVAAQSPPLLPQLFLGASGDRDGRTAVKRCSQWAAKVWAQRHTGITSPCGGGGSKSSSAKGIADDGDTETNARVCMAVSRALGEALEAFQMAGGAGSGGSVSLPKELEGCQLVAVELESHAEVAEAEATARCRGGLMRSLGGRPFCPTLAGVLLQNMPAEETKGGVEMERLKALLRRQQARGVSGGGGGDKGRRGTRVGGAKSAQSGSAMLLADMDAGSCL